jgi:hypothetical protein
MPLRPIPLETRFWKYVNKTSACWLWTGGVTGAGYGALNTSRGSHEPRRQVLVHRLSYELARGPIPDGLFICHTCDTPRCVNPEHLYAGTQSQNIFDSVKRRRFAGHRKLTDGQVRQIRQRFDGGEPVTQIALDVGCSRQTVKEIGARHAWCHTI